jgi:hypothetical protein
MNIQPLPNYQREISVTEAVEPAYERVKLILFKPFNLSKWFVIGFCAWLAGLGESGGSPGGGGNSTNFDNQQASHYYQQARDYVVANYAWIIPLAAALVVLLLAIFVLVVWLSSRGKFMFLHCVAGNVAEVEVPWSKYARQANSLFWFRIAVSLAGMVLWLPLLVFIIIDISRMFRRGEADVVGVLLAVASVLALMLASLVLVLIRKFTMDFVVPIQFLRGSGCTAAWREFLGLLSAHPGKFTIYILFQIVLGMAIAALIGAAILATLCIACCLMSLPYIGTVFLLPVIIFKRAYSLYYLAQYGPQFDVFPPEPAQPQPIQP